MGGDKLRRHKAVPMEVGPEAASYVGSCRGKRGYPSKKQANGALRVLTQTGAAVRVATLNAYNCKVCGLWHLGNRARRPESA